MKIPQRVVCNADHCPLSDRCARHIEYLRTKDTEPYQLMLNTSLVTIGDQGCQHLHIQKKVTVARGFKNMYATVPKKNATSLWKQFPGDISRRQFYRLLPGDVALMPDQQEAVLRFFAEKGADTSLGFDAYEEVDV